MKKGFISITVIYSFLLLFIFTLLTLLVLYTQKTRLIDTVVYEAKEEIYGGISLTIAEFGYTGGYQKYRTPKNGYYYVEVYGAQGGDITTQNTANATFNGGKGGYTSGYIYLGANETLYIYVGGQGTATSSETTNQVVPGGYNGGGAGKNGTSSGRVSTSGGGASDIRYFGNVIPSSSDLEWDSELGLNSRIMVAGGGGGAFSCVTCTGVFNGSGGAGGGLSGGDAYGVNNELTNTYKANGGTQVSGASFGKGYDSTNAAQTPGGGGGYYGGDKNTFSAGGGSSYISGYPGVNSINSSDRTHNYNVKHYSNLYFVGGIMKSGVKSGNGYVRISYIGNSLQKKNSKLDNVRYIKNCINGNSANSYNHWVEIQAIKDGINVAKGISTSGAVVSTIVTDGDIANNPAANGSTGTECITIDLGRIYDIDQLGVWNPKTRIYFDNITYVSSDNQNWSKVLFDDGIGTYQGNIISAYDDFYNNYTNAEYITLNGTSSFDTNIKPTRRTTVLVDGNFSNLEQQARLFSSTGDLYYEAYINGNLEWAFALQNSNGNWVSTSSSVDNSRHVFSLSGLDKKLNVYRNTNVSKSLSETTNSVTKNANNNLYLFGRSNENYMVGNIYWAKIYENGTIVMDLIPVTKKSNLSIGFYDRVSEIFYPIPGAVAH